jgi:alkanesulfonate monooxygenase SsuD/methylene tetrahydromethanopterin reductase-like flavin-dependent oxidoreductase (luciferase family)
MNFGVWIPNCRHLATPDIIKNTAVRAEHLGYDSVWVSDHVVVPRANIPNFGETVFDPLVTLAVIAGATSRVRLGTTVLIVPYRNAVVTAKMIASLDALSGGRVDFGIGAGWVAAESAMLGVPFAERGAMTDEYLEAMRELWTSPTPSFAGTYTQFRDLAFEPKPVQRPHRPLGRRAQPIGAPPLGPVRRGLASDQSLARGAAGGPGRAGATLPGPWPLRAARSDAPQRRPRSQGGAERAVVLARRTGARRRAAGVDRPSRRAGRVRRRAPGPRVPRRRPPARRADGARRARGPVA